ncbi:MAG: hypothetical protein M1157_01555 [Deinococcus sp.]|nr:hypothetical protein [Deinococcus sp.]
MGKTIVFGIFKGNGKAYTEIVPNTKQTTLERIIRGKVALESVVYSHGWRGYDGLLDVGYDKYLYADHPTTSFSGMASTSMALRVSGVLPKPVCPSFMAS